MAQDGLRWGPLVSAVSAATLAISVFLPWYGLTFTQQGAQSALQGLQSVAHQYGNAKLQLEANRLGDSFGSLAGHQFGTVSAHDTLKVLNVALLLLAGIGLAVALLKLAGAAVANAPIAVVGLIASLCVAFRMVDTPAPPGGIVALSLEWGIWLALAASIGMFVSALWPRVTRREAPSPAALVHALEGLSGWTPDG
jgi:hypothetical protein